MIEVLISYTLNRLSKISLKGHAGYDIEGYDIYCAAVSTVWQGGLICLDDPNGYELKMKKGDSQLVIKGERSDHDKVVLEVIVRELKELSKNYPDYVRLKEETK